LVLVVVVVVVVVFRTFFSITLDMYEANGKEVAMSNKPDVSVSRR